MEDTEEAERRTYSPVEIRLVLVHVDVIQRIHSEPGVERKPVLIRPLGNRR